MDCLVTAFSEVTSQSRLKLIEKIGHPAPHHIQEIIEVLHEQWSITEFLFDDLRLKCPCDHVCPLLDDGVPFVNTQEYAHRLLRKYNGVLTYWTGPDAQHAVAWNKNDVLPNSTISIFWRVEWRSDFSKPSMLKFNDLVGLKIKDLT